MDKIFASEEIIFKIEFYDVDSMRIVWHGNYVKFMEKARCALLDRIGFGYLDMQREGYMFPIVDIKLKYMKSLRFGDTAKVVANLIEYENRLKIKYEIYNNDTGELTTKGESTQLCVSVETGETNFVCPQIFMDKIEKLSTR